MFVLKVFMKSGRELPFNFSDLAVANKAMETVENHRVQGSKVRVMDEAGRDTIIPGNMIEALGVTDTVTETQSLTQLLAEIKMAEADILHRLRAQGELAEDVNQVRQPLGSDPEWRAPHSGAGGGAGFLNPNQPPPQANHPPFS